MFCAVNFVLKIHGRFQRQKISYILFINNVSDNFIAFYLTPDICLQN